MESAKERLLRVAAAYPGPVTLCQMKWIRIVGLVGGGLWTVGFLLLAYPGVGDVDPDFSRDDQVVMGLLFAASGLFAVVRSIRDLRRPHMLTLDTNGFHIASPGRDERYAWTEVENFRVVRIARMDHVVWDLSDHDRLARRGGKHVRLLENYGLPRDTLASLMEEWRASVLAGGQQV